MLEVLGQPFIRTASAKGVPWRDVIIGHALPNAAIPTVTIIGFMIGTLIAGARIERETLGSSEPDYSNFPLIGTARDAYAQTTQSLFGLWQGQIGDRLAVQFLQFGFGFKQFELARPAGHEQENDRLGLGIEMRLSRSQRIDARRRQAVTGKQRPQRHAAETDSAIVKEMSPGRMQEGISHGSSQ